MLLSHVLNEKKIPDAILILNIIPAHNLWKYIPKESGNIKST